MSASAAPQPPRKRVGVMISGRGSNLQALLASSAAADYPAKIALVISNVPEAGGLTHTAAAGVPGRVLPHGDFTSREAFDTAVTAAFEDAGVDLICMAGFMRLVTPGFIERWRDRLLNIHPSLLPLFPGLDTHARALAAGVKLHGCTVHFVRPETDTGPIVGQAAVPVLAGDTAEALAARVLAAEHQLYPHCLRLVAEDRVRVCAERAEIVGDAAAGAPDHFATLLNPAP